MIGKRTRRLLDAERYAKKVGCVLALEPHGWEATDAATGAVLGTWDKINRAHDALARWAMFRRPDVKLPAPKPGTAPMVVTVEEVEP